VVLVTLVFVIFGGVLYLLVFGFGVCIGLFLMFVVWYSAVSGDLAYCGNLLILGVLSNLGGSWDCG